MHRGVASSHCATLAEWADHWEREAGRIGGAAEIAFLLRKAARAIIRVTDCDPPAIDLPPEPPPVIVAEAEFRDDA